MKHFTLVLSLAGALALPASAQARDVTFTTVLKNYSGEGAYLALYIVDANGHYQRTLWVAGEKSKYYKHLPGWARGSALRESEYDGLTGASVLSSDALVISSDIPDEMFDAGYEVRVDSSVEDLRDNRSDAAIALTTEGAGRLVHGRGYVQSLSYKF